MVHSHRMRCREAPFGDLSLIHTTRIYGPFIRPVYTGSVYRALRYQASPNGSAMQRTAPGVIETSDTLLAICCFCIRPHHMNCRKVGTVSLFLIGWIDVSDWKCTVLLVHFMYLSSAVGSECYASCPSVCLSICRCVCHNLSVLSELFFVGHRKGTRIEQSWRPYVRRRCACPSLTVGCR